MACRAWARTFTGPPCAIATPGWTRGERRSTRRPEHLRIARQASARTARSGLAYLALSRLTRSHQLSHSGREPVEAIARAPAPCFGSPGATRRVRREGRASRPERRPTSGCAPPPARARPARSSSTRPTQARKWTLSRADEHGSGPYPPPTRRPVASCHEAQRRAGPRARDPPLAGGAGAWAGADRRGAPRAPAQRREPRGRRDARPGHQDAAEAEGGQGGAAAADGPAGDDRGHRRDPAGVIPVELQPTGRRARRRPV